MLYFSRWATFLIMATIVAGLAVIVPNFFSKETVDSWPSFLPKRQVVLGLDLQGGSYLLYQVDSEDYIQKRLRSLVGEVRNAMNQEPRIGYTGLGQQGRGVQLRIRDLAQLDLARQRLTPLRNELSANLLAGGSVYEFDLTVGDDGLARLAYSETGLSQRIRGIVQTSIEVIGRRVDELGTVEPSIQRQGEDRILVEAPGLGDPAALKAIVGQTAQMTFHIVQQQIPTDQAAQSRRPGTIIIPDSSDPTISYMVDEQPLMTGEDLTDAQPAFDQRNNEPIVNFRLSTGGAQKFAQVTRTNVGRPFAIVLDDKVISAPRINEPILGGSGQISGGFSVEEANNLAILLRAGALPARLTIVEERTIGPGLGEDSIRAGEIAALIGTVLICVFMFVVYGFFGILANIAVLVNVALIFAILTMLGATLTLPGIAGIVLTVGTAVDSNVLIYERIREEFKGGRSAIQSIDLGFRRALATIVDANVTTFIAAVALYFLGSGPIRGFAVTHAIGIITTMFTAVLFTRLMVATWVRWRRPSVIRL